MSRRTIVQVTISILIVVCSLFFSLSYAGTTHAAVRASASPQTCNTPGPNDWTYVTSDTKRPVYTIAQSQITVQVQVTLEGAHTNCTFMRSELTASVYSCIGPHCSVDAWAQTFFVNASGYKVYSPEVNACVGNCQGFMTIDIATIAVPVNIGAAGGGFAADGSTIYLGTAEETY